MALATLTLLSRHRRFQSTVTFPDRSRPHQTLTSPPQPLAPTIQLPCLRTRPSRDVVSGVTRCPAWRSSPSATSSGSARVAARVRFPFRARRFRPSPWVASWLLPAFGRRDQRCCGRGRVWTGSPRSVFGERPRCVAAVRPGSSLSSVLGTSGLSSTVAAPCRDPTAPHCSLTCRLRDDLHDVSSYLWRFHSYIHFHQSESWFHFVKCDLKKLNISKN